MQPTAGHKAIRSKYWSQCLKALKLGFQPLEQGEGVDGRAGEPGNNAALPKLTHLERVRLYYGVAKANLAIAGNHHLAALADGQNGRGVPAIL